jgi:Cysteine rich repeat
MRRIKEMSIKTMTNGLKAAVFICTCALASPALAETDIAKKAIAKAEAAISKVLTSCEVDLKTYCAKVTPGEGRLALCIMAHEDKISDKCFGAIFDVAEGIELTVSNIGRAMEVCEDDASKVCSDVEPGEGRIAQCLIDKKADLSSNCRAEVAGFEARFAK